MQAIIITITLTLLLTQSESLPVTSKALESNSDQLIWQSAWFSSQLQNDGKETPFTGEPRKITAKSIFITPNFSQNYSHCPPGYKVDDNGKCIKVVNINQDDILVTRLQNFFSQHQTTGDTKSIDYDYSGEDESSNEPTHYTLPLAPIWSESNTSQYSIKESESSTTQYEIELNDFAFHNSNSSTNGAIFSSTANVAFSDDRLPQSSVTDDQESIEQKVSKEDLKKFSTEKIELDKNSTNFRHNTAMHVEGDDMKLKENEATTEDSLSSYENVDMTNPILDTTSSDTLRVTTSFGDDFDKGEVNYSTTSSDENSQTEKTIDDTSDATTIAIQLDDYFDTILLNDSLLIGESSSYENTTDDAESDSTTITAFTVLPFEDGQPVEITNTTTTTSTVTTTDEAITSTKSQLLSPTAIKNSFTVFSNENNEYSHENRIIKDDQQIADLESAEVSNKFVYHHLTTTETSLSIKGSEKSLSETSSTFVRFPSDVETKSSVRFPDEKPKLRFPDDKQLRSNPVTMSFSWPRDVGYQTVDVMRFWKQQPLIEDFKFFTRGNARNPQQRGQISRLQTTYRRSK